MKPLHLLLPAMNALVAGLRAFWRGLDQIRRALLNLLLLAVLGALLWVWLMPGPPALKDNTLLVLDLRGPLVEQASGTARERALALARGGESPAQLRLRDVLRVIDAAAADPKITRLLLDVDELGASGLVSLREVAAALQRFKAAGKPVIAWAESYTQGQYLLAAQASEVYLHPMGYVALEGFGRHRIYYKDLFDRLGVQAHVVRAGRYKNFAEPWSANGPSAETLESDQALYGGLWATYTGDVEKARKLPPGSVMAGIERLPQLLSDARGDLARLSLDARLVDGLKTEAQLREQLLKAGAAAADDAPPASPGVTPALRKVGFSGYLARLQPRTDGDAVGVVVAEGSIVNGEASPGTIGGRSTAALIRAAREDKRVKAVVLRVRSPGGSAFASEQVREELALTRAAGKPVVVSMGDLAASGGYWISLAADEVIADAATITGSIGVVGLLPTVEGAMAHLGLKTGGVTTTWLGDAYDPRRGLDARFQKMVQQSIDHAYADFIGKVAQARKSTPEKVDAIAQGRVWTGAAALERGLVDRLGSFGDALQSAARRAQLPQDARVVYFERGNSRWERLAARFVAEAVVPLAGAAGIDGAAALVALARTPVLAPELAALAELVQSTQAAAAPRGGLPAPLAHCGCLLVP
jgi:protease IV